jgi:hypothetical protein
MTDHLRDATKMVAEPVAWGMPRPDGLILDVICPEEHDREPGQYTVPLYAAPQPKAEQEPFGYFRSEPFGWTDCGEDDEGAIALYAAPQPRRQPPPSED